MNLNVVVAIIGGDAVAAVTVVATNKIPLA